MSIVQADNLRELLLSQTPMIDVRAPVEFATGALPWAANLPLMVDDERHRVGLCYKQRGQPAAIALGHQLVAGSVRQQRIEAWRAFIAAHPTAVLYCARGGLRSRLSCEWLAELGVDCPQVVGGYKALRGFLYRYLRDHSTTQPLTVLAGMTGTGKTALLSQLGHSVDLEGAANHKGSSFGRPLDGQPSQTNFENRIAIALLTVQHHHPGRTVVVEDESRTIGARHLPPYLVERMANSALVVVNVPFEERLERLWQEYVVERHADSLAFYGDGGDQQFADHLRASVVRINKRLGGLRTQQVLALVEQALVAQQRDNFASHRHWLAALTRDYYDPMYSYQLDRKRDKIAFSGSPSEVLAFLRNH